jgi:hypothetical protein
MNSEVVDKLKLLKQYVSEAEKAFEEQKKELELTRLERDFYKDIAINFQIDSNCNTCSNVVYVTIYSKDNGEGVDTDTCVGVFTNKLKAKQATMDVCIRNKELHFNGFTIQEFKVDKELITNDTVYVMQHDEEAYCEVSTTIVGVECYISVNGYNNDELYHDCYVVDYIVDTVYHIEN